MKTIIVLLSFAYASVNLFPPAQHEVFVDIDIEPIPNPEKQGRLFQWQKRYQPIIEVVEGCKIYPAWDIHGHRSKGMEVGPYRWLHPQAGCESMKGQVYTRLGSLGVTHCIMYAFFTPRVEDPHNMEHAHSYGWYNVITWHQERFGPRKMLRGIDCSVCCDHGLEGGTL